MDREFLESLGLDENVSRRILEEHGKEVERECQRADSAETSCREAREALARNEYAGAVRCAVGELGLKFSSKAAERDFIARLEAENLELKEGRLEGLEAFVQAQREADPGAFDSERRLPRFVAPAGLAGRPADHVAQARAMGAERAAAMRSSGEILKNFL